MKYKEFKEKLIGEVMEITELEGVDGYGIEYIFPDEDFPEEIGVYEDIKKGQYCLQINLEDLDKDDNINLHFETVGEWKIIKNETSNIYKTYLDYKSVNIKITEVEIV